MLDIKRLRENPEQIKESLKAKNVNADIGSIISLDKRRRALTLELDELRSKKNQANDTISRLIQEKKDPKETIASMKEVSMRISELEPQVKSTDQEIQGFLLALPNPAHPSVPIGGEQHNTIVRSYLEPKTFDFKPKSHIDIAEHLDIIDFKRATKITGSNFILFKGVGALLERALINFMLDTHVREHGYTEVMPPVVVNRDSMTATGQLPKMAEDMYHLPEEDLFLIPTAEVPVTNIHRDEVLQANQLPISYTAFTPCFRREAGSYGKDTRGLIRVHQFDKVELVKFVRPETSYQEHERLLNHAETIFKKLGLPYRVVLLASGDLSFAAAKCFDIESYAPGVDKWLEVSSCSNFEDFQARRGNIRFKDKDMNKPEYVHTLNGSGLALARTVVAILENYQTAEGSVMIPDVLVPYMHGLTEIKPA